MKCQSCGNELLIKTIRDDSRVFTCRNPSRPQRGKDVKIIKANKSPRG